MLQWQRSQSPPCPWDWSQCTALAASSGNIDLLEWLRIQGLDATWGDAPTAAAVQKGNLPVLQWLDAQGCAPQSGLQAAWPAAAIHGHKHILQWLHTRKIPWGDEMPGSWATTASVPILMFLNEIKYPLAPEVQDRVIIALKTLCTYYRLLRWCRRAVSDPSRKRRLTTHTLTTPASVCWSICPGSHRSWQR